MRRLILTLFLGCQLLVAGTAGARDDDISAATVRELVAKGELMPLEEILRRNEGQLAGRIIEIELERKSVGYVYEIKVLRPDGRKSEFKIDGRTGDIMSGRRR